MKAIKILLAVVAAAAALVVVALALVLLVDPNDYKGYVTDWVEARTGRALTIDGDVELAFFPWLAIETEAVTLGQPAGFDADEPFATVERVSAGVRLLPLLERRFEIGRVRVDGLTLHLARGADGRGNWQDFGTSSAPANEPQADTLTEQLDIERIEIHDGEVRWYEEPSAPRYVFRGIELTTGRIRAGEPVDVTLAVDAEDAESGRRFAVETRASVGLAALGAAAADAAVSLRGFALRLAARDQAGAELAAGTLDAESVDALGDGSVSIAAARVDARVAPTDALPAGLDLGANVGDLRFDPRAGTFAVDGLTTRLGDITAEWRVDARDVIDAPQLEGELRIANAAVGPALETLGAALPDGVDPNVLGRIDASASFRVALSLADAAPADAATGTSPALGPWRIDELRLDEVAVDLAGTPLRGDAVLGDDGVLRVRVDVPEHVPGEGLRTLAAAYAPAGIDFAAIDRLAVTGRAELGLADGRLAVPELRATLLDAEIAASIEAPPAAADASGRLLRGTLRTTPVDPARIAALLGERMPAAISPAELGALAVDARFEYDTAAGRLALDDAALEAFGLAATGRVVLTGVGDRVTASGEAHVAPFSPRELMTRFGQPVPETSDPSTLQRAALSARFEAGADGARFRDIELVLDDTRITGEYAIDGVANPAHRFELAIDRVNVDRYLPPRSQDLADDASDDTRTAGDIELPAEALANLRIDGNVEVGELVLAGLEMRAVATRIAVGDGRAILDSARASLYGGEFSGRFVVDTTAEPGLALTGRATSLALEPLITALTGDANVSGTGDFDLDLAGTGRTVLDNVASANGRVTFSMRDGAIEGFNLGRALCVVYNAARRLPAPAQQPSRTEYVLIGGTATVQDGVATSNDLLARASFMDLTGAGHLALAEQRLDYTLEAKLTGSTGIPGCEEMGQLVGESLPLTLRGTVTDPDIRPDFSEIIERRLREALQDRVRDRLLDLLR
ncbi:MAG TPA: AsmA family protein [Gammaproteobacteria bacterium]